jgi:hypothetical protein
MALPNERTGIRAVQAADRVINDPDAGPMHVRKAIDEAVADYRRAFARRLIEAGVGEEVVWGVVVALPIEEGIRPDAPTVALVDEGVAVNRVGHAWRAAALGALALVVGLAAVSVAFSVYLLLSRAAGLALLEPAAAVPVGGAAITALGVVWLFARFEND